MAATPPPMSTAPLPDSRAGSGASSSATMDLMSAVPTLTRADAFSPGEVALNYIQRDRAMPNRINQDTASIRNKRGKEKAASMPLVIAIDERSAAEYLHPLKNTMTRQSLFINDLFIDTRAYEARLSDGTAGN